MLVVRRICHESGSPYNHWSLALLRDKEKNNRVVGIVEAYLRLVKIDRINWQDRTHFFAVAARIMRRILVDYARARRFAKRGGGAERVNFNETLVISSDSGPDVEELNDALQALERVDARKAQVVEMRYFSGLTAEEIGSVLNISPKVVNRDWAFAKTWLTREMTRGRSNAKT